MLIDEIKKRMFAAIKAKNTIEKEILRTAIGEVTRAGEDADDTRVIGVLRKISKGCQETLELTEDEAQKQNLREELAVLDSLLPRTLSVEQITELLAPVADAIKAAGNVGQATGIAMKELKARGAEAAGKDAATAVQALRS
jgi:hypothetical protein